MAMTDTLPGRIKTALLIGSARSDKNRSIIRHVANELTSLHYGLMAESNILIVLEAENHTAANVESYCERTLGICLLSLSPSLHIALCANENVHKKELEFADIGIIDTVLCFPEDKIEIISWSEKDQKDYVKKKVDYKNLMNFAKHGNRKFVTSDHEEFVRALGNKRSKIVPLDFKKEHRN